MSFNYPNDPADQAIQLTNDDATVSRLSAVQLGYFDDPFVKYFVKRPTRRMPIINRGSYIRSRALDTLVQQFLSIPCLSASKKKQIVNLGSGFDTRYFMIKSGALNTKTSRLESSFSNYFEVDFPENVVKKARIIKQRKELQVILQQRSSDNDDDNDNQQQPDIRLEKGGTELSSHDYHLIGGDLRQWDQVVERLFAHGLDPQVPTLFLSECVLIYLPPDSATGILDWIQTTMSDCVFALYEQIRPDDNFGKIMIRNLQVTKLYTMWERMRNIELKGIHDFPSLAHQERRFLDVGWDNAMALDINTIHNSVLDQQERSRIAKLEIFDEMEEWHLLSEHYCVAWAYKSNHYEEFFAKHLGLKTLV
ncbi:S-adenosyl-L-methionine-dependent methyltransferase [Absidia repens]|uniref:Leucine carboxyl methyltransferase 1 n=1 Tax=Absidia repens TaxID=90262 RepID=A0A1X2J235_9FUNG|nr:S-adenosyl-L-methionine-dependent methyltransferase [Absidia repens]